jgi:hypothetical protein
MTWRPNMFKSVCEKEEKIRPIMGAKAVAVSDRFSLMHLS